MCYILELITRKKISDDYLSHFSQNYGIYFYNKTDEMNNPQKGAYYYGVLYGGCSCDLYSKHDNNTVHLIDLLKEYVKVGNLTLFFVWQDDRYEEICNDIHRYIDSPNLKKIDISITEFLDVFMTENFDGENVIYNIYND